MRVDAIEHLTQRLATLEIMFMGQSLMGCNKLRKSHAWSCLHEYAKDQNWMAENGALSLYHSLTF